MTSMTTYWDRMPMEKRTSVRRLVTYVVVGAASFAIDFGTLVTLKQVVHTPLWLAVSVGYWAGFLVNFSLQRRLTFSARGRLHAHLVRYVVLVVLNYLGTLVIVAAAAHAGIGYGAGKIIAVAVLVFVNYPAYGRWVFAGSGTRT